MSIEPIPLVAVVGVGAILPDAPDAVDVLGQRARRPLLDHGGRPQRWDPALYYDPNPKAPDKTYSKIGGWVRDWTWDPLAWKLPIPPRSARPWTTPRSGPSPCTRAALLDYGWPERPLDGERTAVVLGNAMSGEQHYLTCAAHRVSRSSPTSWRRRRRSRTCRLTCARRSARSSASVGDGRYPRDHRGHHARRAGQLHGRSGGEPVRPPRPELRRGRGVRVGARRHRRVVARPDRTTTTTRSSPVASTATWVRRAIVKFCKIGALSATGTRPFDAGADGFVMGEGAGLFVLKRWPTPSATATASTPCCAASVAPATGAARGSPRPNPVGQRLAVERAWRSAGLSPASCGMMECHGTSTRVGDVVEVTSIGDAFTGADSSRDQWRSVRRSRTSAISRPPPGPPASSRR